MSHYTQHNLSSSARETLALMFGTLSYAAEIFLFAYIGVTASTLAYERVITLALMSLVRRGDDEPTSDTRSSSVSSGVRCTCSPCAPS